MGAVRSTELGEGGKEAAGRSFFSSTTAGGEVCKSLLGEGEAITRVTASVRRELRDLYLSRG